ncbi:MAG: isoaspartyl peptidase/L-asparaginase [Deltaproteobacteria bacterium]|nr:MAG: isoaspartyl peptidase/L-asparaginase [Deltaproteobacteria bacterium]
MTERRHFALALHGGAGNIRRGTAREPAIRKEFQACLEEGRSRLSAGEESVDVVEAMVRRLEAHPLFNAGRGAVLTSTGGVELDASIMDGRNRAAGGVACLASVLHPISVARRVMDRGEHVLLVGEGAAAFARQQGFETVPAESLVTAQRRRQLDRARTQSRIRLDHDASTQDDDGRGTVGAVALDLDGHLAAATSTGGLINQLPGRVGDSAVIGAGTWADDATCAVSATGHGEAFIRAAVAHEVDAGMRLASLDLESAARRALERAEACGGRGGLIAVDGSGRIAMPWTTAGMIRGRVSANQEPRISLFDNG